MIAAANLEGMTIHKRGVAQLDRVLAANAERLRDKLAPHGVTDKVVRSPKQLSALMFDTWKLRQVNGKSTSKDVLTELAPEDDRADDIRLFREALGLRSKFIGAIVKSVIYNDDGMTRPQANVFGTYTGRLTYSSTIGKKGTKAEKYVGFALHQMKRDKDFRNMIVAPEGYDLVEFDAAGQEFRWMAIQSFDETMLMLCMPGEDAHSFMGAQIANRDYSDIRRLVKEGEAKAKAIRQGGKVKTFRIRARTDHGMKITEAESYKICRTYTATYRGVPKYWERQIALGRRQGYAETLAGRRVQVKGNWNGPQQWPMESTMINYPIQGTGGDQKYLAMQCMKDRLNEYDARFAWDLHDGIYFYVPRDRSLKFAHEMREMLGQLPYRQAWGFSPPIPLPFDAKIGPSWGLLQELKD
jgi:DNA polymerase-1